MIITDCIVKSNSEGNSSYLIAADSSSLLLLGEQEETCGEAYSVGDFVGLSSIASQHGALFNSKKGQHRQPEPMLFLMIGLQVG